VGISGTWGALPVPDHVVIVIEENHSLDEVIGNPAAPFINGLAASGANFTSFYAVTHPSQPNYLTFFSGSTQGVIDDTVPPAGAPYSTANLGAALQSVGRTFAGYSQGLPGAGSTIGSSGDYVRKHNPWVNWQDATVPLPANKLGPGTNLPFTSFPTTDAGFAAMPTVSIVVPDLQNDMHDGTIAMGDSWLSANLTAYRNWAQTHNSMLILTFDEDDHSQNNRIPTIINGPMVQSGAYDAPWTLHNLLRTVGDMYGATAPGNAAYNLPITGVWNGDPAGVTRTFQKGLSGYSGAKDTYLDETTPGSSFGTATQVVVDNSPRDQGLIRFDNLFSANGGPIPNGAVITSARLNLYTGSNANDQSATSVELHKMLAAWSESDTWTSMGGGLAPGEMEAATAAVLPAQLSSVINFDVTTAVQDWANGGENDGWALMPSGADGWRWNSSEFGTLDFRPSLTITYVPEPTTSALLIVGLGLLRRRRR
jgi:hypothetical protein